MSGARQYQKKSMPDYEVAVGNAIVKNGIDRKKLFLVTKVNYKSYENVRETVERSLKNLQTDYIDLLLLHWPFANYYNAWRELEKLYEEGKLRAIGVSNFEPAQLVFERMLISRLLVSNGRTLSFISTTGRNPSAAAGAVCGRDHLPVVSISWYYSAFISPSY